MRKASPLETPLTEDNFILFAAKIYRNPSCESMDEFYDDLNRFKYIKRLFTRYEETGELKVRLVLNHLIVLYNLFGLDCTRMLFLKFHDRLHMLKPFLVSLNFLPETVGHIGAQELILTSAIPMDQEIIRMLRQDLSENV